MIFSGFFWIKKIHTTIDRKPGWEVLSLRFSGLTAMATAIAILNNGDVIFECYFDSRSIFRKMIVDFFCFIV